MHWIDIVLLVLLVISTITGFRQGLIKSVLSLIGVIAGIVLASNFYEPLAKVFGFIGNEDTANIVAFILILVVVIIAASLLAKLLDSIIKAVMLGWVNRIGGAVFGLLMGVISISAILAIWVKFFGTDMLAESFIAGLLLDKIPIILSILPGEFDVVRDFFK
jgi:membrane protein required for colicin V production